MALIDDSFSNHCAQLSVHRFLPLGVPFDSERVTIQNDVGRSPATNRLDERIGDTKVPVRRAVMHGAIELVQQRFPVGWNSVFWSRCGLIKGMRMRRQQLRTFNHCLRLVIKEPILAWLEARDDRMPACSRVLRGMLARRAIAASDVPTLGTSTEVKPPAIL